MENRLKINSKIYTRETGIWAQYNKLQEFVGRIQIDLLFAMVIDRIHLGPCRKVTGISDQTRSSGRNSCNPIDCFLFQQMSVFIESISLFSQYFLLIVSILK